MQIAIRLDLHSPRANTSRHSHSGVEDSSGRLGIASFIIRPASGSACCVAPIGRGSIETGDIFLPSTSDHEGGGFSCLLLDVVSSSKFKPPFRKRSEDDSKIAVASNKGIALPHQRK